MSSVTTAVVGQVTQKTTIGGALLGLLAVVAPGLTPAFFASLGIPTATAQLAAMLVAGVLVGYQEKTAAPGAGK